MATEAFRIDGPLITGLDQAGDPLAGGKLYLYEPNTTTPKPSWQDEAKTVPNTHPIILDAAGRGRAYIDGQYSVRMDDKDDVQVWYQAVISDPTVSVNINNGGVPGDDITSPLVTKGDLATRDDNDVVRLPVGGDDLILTGESTQPTGLQYKKLKDIPLDPDAETPEFPGSGGGVEEAPEDGTPYSRQDAAWVPAGSGSGIKVPTDTPVPIGGIVTYDDTGGTQAQGNPSVAVLDNHQMTSVDGTTFEIKSLLGGGTTLTITPGGGDGSPLVLAVPLNADEVNNPVTIFSSAALDVHCDGKLSLQGYEWDITPGVADNNIFLVAEDTPEKRIYFGGTTTSDQPTAVESGHFPSFPNVGP